MGLCLKKAEDDQSSTIALKTTKLGKHFATEIQKAIALLQGLALASVGTTI